MAWKLNGKTISVGRSWTDANGITHPTNWMSWTDEEKKAAGLTWVDDVAWHDDRFYWGRNTDGSLIPKSLTDINHTWTQTEIDAGEAPSGTSAGAAKLDGNGNQMVTVGLKNKAIEYAKQQAAGMLSLTDWYVIRKAETDVAIPSTISTYRTGVRTACAAIETKITNAADFAAFMALYDSPVDSDGSPTGPAPINTWPDAP